jgi:hypothetical protein
VDEPPLELEIRPAAASAGVAPSLPAELQERVNKAIDRGVAYLRRTQCSNGSWTYGGKQQKLLLDPRAWAVGHAAMPGLTLLECGVAPTDPAVQKAAAYVRKHAPPLNRTYEISLAVLFLDRLGDPADRPLIRSLALRLVAGQNARGGWAYTCPRLKPDQEEKLVKILSQRQDKPRQPTPAPDKPATPRQGGKQPTSRDLEGDNSNTQFAILALWAARRHDLPLQQTVAQVEQRFRSSQMPGGWSYYGRTGPYGSMTCVGLLGLALGRAWESQTKPAGGAPGPLLAKDEGISRGLHALGTYLTDPGDVDHKGKLNTYFLWSVERVGVLYGLKTIGGKDWYRWGVQYLLPTQKGNGSWSGNVSGPFPTTDTCMALLFLKRADLVPGLGEKLRLRVAITDPDADPEGGSQKKSPGEQTDSPGSKPAPAPEAGPLAVSLGEVKAGTATERRFVVRHATPFRITAIQGTDNYLLAKTDSESKAAHELTVTLQPSAPGEVSRTLRLVTDLPGRREIEVTVKARAVP